MQRSSPSKPRERSALRDELRLRRLSVSVRPRALARRAHGVPVVRASGRPIDARRPQFSRRVRPGFQRRGGRRDRPGAPVSASSAVQPRIDFVSITNRATLLRQNSIRRVCPPASREAHGPHSRVSLRRPRRRRKVGARRSLSGPRESAPTTAAARTGRGLRPRTSESVRVAAGPRFFHPARPSPRRSQSGTPSASGPVRPHRGRA